MPLLALLLAAPLTLTTDLPGVCHLEAFEASCDVSRGHACTLSLPPGSQGIHISGCVDPSVAEALGGRRYRIVEVRALYDNPIPLLLGVVGLAVGGGLLAGGLSAHSAALDIAGIAVVGGGFALGLAMARHDLAQLPRFGKLVEESAAPPAAASGPSLSLRF